MMVVDGAIATGLGVLSIVKRQFRRLRHGTPPPEDLTQVSAGASSELRTAVLLVILGGALMLLGKSTVAGLFP